MPPRDAPLTWSTIKPGMSVWLAAPWAARAGIWPEDLDGENRAEARIWGTQDPRPWNGGVPRAVVRVAGIPRNILVDDLAALERRVPNMQMDWCYLVGEAPRMPEPGDAVGFRLHMEDREPDDEHDNGMRTGVYLGRGRWAVAGSGLCVPTVAVACWRRENLPKIYRLIEGRKVAA